MTKQADDAVLVQAASLLRLGVSDADIDRTISWVEDNCPPHQNPLTWVPSVDDLAADLITPATVVDAMTAWKMRAPAKYRNLLDAESF